MLSLSLTVNSGRIIYRNKIDSLTRIFHPGIEIGVDMFNNKWILHHHIENGVPAISRMDNFSKGQPVFYDDRPVNYNRFEIVSRGLKAWDARVSYDWLRQNCQHLVNTLVHGEHRSESVEKISESFVGVGAFVGLIGLISGNVNLVKIGALAAGMGATGKIANRKF